MRSRRPSTAASNGWGLDIIVANAGIGNGGQTLISPVRADWTDMIDVNLSGVWKTVESRCAAYDRRWQGWFDHPHQFGRRAQGLPHTATTSQPSTVVGLMRTFAVELGHHFIRVNSVHPTNEHPAVHERGTMKLFRPDLRTRVPTTWPPWRR